MSDYCRYKQVWYPLTESDEKYFCEKYGLKDAYDITWDVPELQEFFKPDGKMSIEFACDYDGDGKCNKYLAYTLYGTYGDESGDFGRARLLTEKEQEKYKEMFEKVLPNIESSKLKYLDYCYYNCSEPPDYYNGTDEFYNEI